MIQKILVVTAVALAIVHLVRSVIQHHFSEKKKCKGCAVNKAQQHLEQ
jgi:hypothetical protein